MTLQQKYQQKIIKIAKEFSKISPEKIILFGSSASDKISSESDIDICVIIKTNNNLKTKRRLREIIWQKGIGFEPEVDIHVYPPNIYYDWLKRNDPFIEEIEKGKVLYDKRSTDRTR